MLLSTLGTQECIFVIVDINTKPIIIKRNISKTPLCKSSLRILLPKFNINEKLLFGLRREF